MIRQIEALPAAGRQDIEAIIDDWLAVEEAVVGGLVHHIMPLLLRRFTGASMEAQLEEAMAARHLHSQYRYLQQGMRSVAGLGVAATVTRYRNHPEYFWGRAGAHACSGYSGFCSCRRGYPRREFIEHSPLYRN
jgi:hypothetical protein